MKTKRVVLRKKFRQRRVPAQNESNIDIENICGRLDSVIKRSEKIEVRLNEIEERRQSAFPSSSFVRNSISQYSTEVDSIPPNRMQNGEKTSFQTNSTYSTPTTLKFNTSPTRTTEIDPSTINSEEIRDPRYTSPYEKRKMKFAKTPTMKQILIELNELSRDVRAVVERQNELMADIKELREKENM